jgi:Leucine-rich repeat (LRR) protein
MVQYPNAGVIIPLFYDVEPSHVRYPDKGESSYKKAFEKHIHSKNADNKDRYDQKTIAAWKDALHQVSKLSGWTLQAMAGFEGKLVKRVVMDVLKTLDYGQLDVAEHPVGLERRMNDVINLLDIGLDKDDRVIVLGIWGMGGLGKTTLAKAVFNNICRGFEASCFLADVRVNKISDLQAQILTELSGDNFPVRNVHRGKARMKARLGNIRVLVVLDDISHKNQLDALNSKDYFGPGSRVIVTTRDQHILKLGQAKIYEMKEFENDEALQLFSWHAFLRPCPDQDYKDLSLGIVEACRGLPLSLEVLGASLYGKTDRILWNEALKKLQSVKYDDIRISLEISYEALEDDEKDIFLDIACFFLKQGNPWFLETAPVNVISFWESLYAAPNYALENLTLKSLVTVKHVMPRYGVDDLQISNKGYFHFAMHDLIRDMGRAIVANESRELGERSRLWNSEDALEVLEGGSGTKRVRGLSFQTSNQNKITLPEGCLASMSSLKLLWLDGATIEGDLGQISSNLRWLRWRSCPLKRLPLNWNMKHLALLDLTGIGIGAADTGSLTEELWNERTAQAKPKNLRSLVLNMCLNLRGLPNLSDHTSLLSLELESCENLQSLRIEDLPTSGSLFSLEKLILSYCTSLTSLPKAVGEFKYLRYLNMKGCSNLVFLPDEFGKLDSLEELNMSECEKLSELPQTFGNLRRLKILKIIRCFALRHLPPSFSELESLAQLNASHSNIINGLPDQIGNLRLLEYLNLEDTYACRLPPSISNLRKLATLILNTCVYLSELPALPEGLVKVDVGNCRQLNSISSMSHLIKLETLVLYQCEGLTELPNLRSCQSLRLLDLYGCKNITSLTGMEGLKALETLYLSGSGVSVLNLGQLMKDMRCLQVLSISAKQLPQCLEHKLSDVHSLKVTFSDIISSPLKKNIKCTAIVVCLVLNLFDSVNFIVGGSVSINIISKRSDREIFVSEITVDTKRVGARRTDGLCVLVFRENHPLIMSLESADAVLVQGCSSDDIIIKGSGMQLLYRKEENAGGNEDVIFEELERDLNSLLQFSSGKEKEVESLKHTFPKGEFKNDGDGDVEEDSKPSHSSSGSFGSDTHTGNARGGCDPTAEFIRHQQPWHGLQQPRMMVSRRYVAIYLLLFLLFNNFKLSQ